MIETSRKQKEKRILDLHNDGYSIRDIAQQEHKSFRDIGAIIEREQKRQETIERQTHQADIASRAYSLFSKGKPPVEVAIELKLRQPDVQMLYGEYLKLVGLEKLHKVYEEVGEEIENFFNLYNMMKASGINALHVKRLVRIANEGLPSVEQRFQLANKRVMELQGDVRNSAFTFQQLSDGISSMNTTLRSLEAEKQREQQEIGELYQKRMKLQSFVRHYDHNNKGYLAITECVQEKVNSILSENKLFLNLGVESIIELIANDPAKYGFSIESDKCRNSSTSGQLEPDGSYCTNSDYNSIDSNFSSSRVQDFIPILPIRMKQKELEQNKPLLSNDALVTLVQEAEKKLFNNIIKQVVPAIITVLLLKLPRSYCLLPPAPGQQKPSQNQSQ
jgi:hypothetical protein